MSGGSSRRYPPELRERAVRMVAEISDQHESEWAAISEVARLLFGADRPDKGAMMLDGKRFAPRSPAAAVKAGLGLVPEERRAEVLAAVKKLGAEQRRLVTDEEFRAIIG